MRDRRGEEEGRVIKRGTGGVRWKNFRERRGREHYVKGKAEKVRK